jgi:glycosyltransferase involved in cell wall biosynthesis
MKGTPECQHPLSVPIVSYNREKIIKRCIESIKDIADEVIIVDSMSEDKTAEIAESLGVRVIRRPCHDLYEQKAFATSQCKNEWVLYLDADEVVSEKLKENIVKMLNSERADKFSGFLVNRRNIYIGEPMKHVWYPDRVLRLFKKSRARWVGKIVHGHVEVDGRIGKLKGDIIHYSYENIREHLDRTISFSKKVALIMEGRKFRYIDLLVRPPWAFFKHFFLKRGFLDGTRGLIISYSAATDAFARYALLWERNIEKNMEIKKGERKC